MKMEGNNSVIQIEDDEFLSEVAALEADALSNSNKRRKITPASALENDGLYTAALRGTDSLLLLPRNPKRGGGGYTATGNFTKDKDKDKDNEDEEKKPCPCGAGACVVLTANTQKNPGRKFYKCPLRPDAGGCGFFQWCDAEPGAGGGFGTQISSFPDIPCPCGSGSCLVLTAKTGKNVGQPFYRCPGNQGSSCGFFKWCNDQTFGGGVSATPNSKSNHMGEKNKPSYDLGSRSGSACFKCGKGGHWAKDCSAAAEGQRPAPSNTCYKCNQAGHWARDCPSTSSHYVKPQTKY